MEKTRAQFSKERRRKIRSKHQLIALISPPTMLAIPGHLACHSLQDKEPQAFNFLALTSRTPAPSQLHNPFAQARSMSRGSSKAGGKKRRRGRGRIKRGNSERNKVDIDRFASLGDCFGATVKYGINVLLHRGSPTLFPPPPYFFHRAAPQRREINFSPVVTPWLRRTFPCYWSKRGNV